MGIKGQYLIFDTGVINIRKFGGYEVFISWQKNHQTIVAYGEERTALNNDQTHWPENLTDFWPMGGVATTNCRSAVTNTSGLFSRERAIQPTLGYSGLIALSPWSNVGCWVRIRDRSAQTSCVLFRWIHVSVSTVARLNHEDAVLPTYAQAVMTHP